MNTYHKTLSSFEDMLIRDRERQQLMNKQHLVDLDRLDMKPDQDDLDYVNVIYNELKEVKIFKLDEDLVQVFLNTDSDLDYIHLPFKTIFLDCIVPITDNLKIMGMYLVDSTTDKSITVLCYAEEAKADSTIRHFINFGLKYWNINAENNQSLIEKIECDLDKPFFRRKAGIFIISFLKFLNNPEVEIINKEYTSVRIKRRLEEGRPVNNHLYLKITGKTREYISSFSEQIANRNIRHTFSWIVRGYYMRFKNKRYKNKIGSETWVAPYVKGVGGIKNKSYIVSEKKKLFYNQTLMEEIIKKLFPNHLILRNTRGFLDGLEIDCYIPDLKLGFEYNGEQHYNLINAFHKSENELIKQKKRDYLKNKIADEKGIKLVTIRYDEILSEQLIKSKLKDKQNNLNQEDSKKENANSV